MRTLTALLLALFLLSGTAPAQQTSDDDRIYDQVRRRLANDPDVQGGALQVDVQQGVVVLRGRVGKDKLKAKAEKLARKVKGVRQVDNQLQVAPL